MSLESAAEWVHVDELRPWEKNPRKNDPAVPRVAESIKRFGFVSPIVVWQGGNRMVAGHTRLKAMRALLKESPGFVAKGAPAPGMVRVAFHEFADEHEADVYALADNRLGEIAEWDDDAVADITRQWSKEDVAVAGFDDDEPAAELGDPDDVPDGPAQGEAVTQRGDLWLLGEHRLLCGDSTSEADVARVMNGERAVRLWTDPPYNVAYVGKTKDALTIKNDSMDDVAFRAFLVAAFSAADAVMAHGAVFYIAHADSEGFNFRGATRDVGWKMAQCLIWAKDVFVMGRQDYHWKHEPILYGWKPGAGHHSVKDRTQDTLWEIPRPKRSEEHPTMKPVALITRAIQNSSSKGALVLDVFGGSGTTLIACEETQRLARLVELDPHYCDVIVARREKYTGKKATRVPAGEAAA